MKSEIQSIGTCPTCKLVTCPNPKIRDTTPEQGCRSWSKSPEPQKTLTLARIPTLKDGSDAQTAKQLNKLFSDAQNGMRRIVSLGLFAWEIKELKLKHGEFGPWLAAHLPKLSRLDSSTGKPKASHALSDYMSLTKSVLEKVGYSSVGKYLNYISNSPEGEFHRGGRFLLLSKGKVPAAAKPLREKIFSLIDGKTQHQLFLEFKQAEDDDDKPKRGRLKGQGGASKQQRETAAQREEAARIEELEITSDETADWLTEVSDDKHLGLISEPARAKLLESLEVAVTYLRRLAKGGACRAATSVQGGAR